MLDAVEKKTGYAGTTPFLKEATGSDSGLMSAADKEKLDSIGIISNEEIERVWNLL